jgi:arylsulfatase A-like enzyme
MISFHKKMESLLNHIVTIIILFVLSLLFSLITSAYVHAAAKQKPNVLIIMVDNLGWGELGVYGGGVLRGTATPRLDALAKEGTRLLNFNVETQCTPTRSALMTGRHPIRSGTTKVVFGKHYGLVRWEQTLAELMSDAGYATGMFGKWHLGDSAGRFPTDQGFDTWYGIANTTDEAEYSSQYQFDESVGRIGKIYESKKDQTPVAKENYDLDTRRSIDAEITQRTIAFMKDKVKSNKPFFAYVPLTQPHMPTIPHKDFIGKTGNGDYADVIAEIDYRSGQMLDAVEKLGIRDNTIVIWFSDNGPEGTPGQQGTAGYWRGHYFTALEGSLRVPFMIRWPGKVPENRVSNEIVHVVDILPTLANAIGFDVPEDRMIDGVNQAEFLFGKSEDSSREGFPVYNGNQMFAYKWRNWKIHFVELDNMFGEVKRLNVPLLYNLITDPKEQYDILTEAEWVWPIFSKRIGGFRDSLELEPPIQTGTPDPYVPVQ